MRIPGVRSRRATSVSGAQMKQIIVLLVFVVIGTLVADQFLSFSYAAYYAGRIMIAGCLIVGLFFMQWATAMRVSAFKSRFGPMTIWWGTNQSVRVYNCVRNSKLIARKTLEKKNPDGENHRFYMYRTLFDKYIEDRERGIFRFNTCKILMPCTYDQAFEEEANTAFEYDGVPCKIKSCAPVFHLMRPSSMRGDPIPLLWYSDGPYYVTRSHLKAKLLEPTVEDIERAERAYDKSLAIPMSIELAGIREERDALLRLEPDRQKRVHREVASLKRHYGDVEHIPSPIGKMLRNKWLWVLIIGVIAMFVVGILFFPQYFPWFQQAAPTTTTTTAGPTTTATTQYFTETTVTLSP